MIATLVAATALAVAGAALLVLARRRLTRVRTGADDGPTTPSPVSLAVFGLACLGVAYASAAWALALGWPRPPVWVAAALGAAASSGSIAIDRLESRRTARNGGADGGGN